MHDDPLFEEWIQNKRQRRMDTIDAMPHDLRECVYDYGLNVVTTFVQSGIREPRIIRHIVETVLNEFSPTRGVTSAQGIRAAPGLGEKKEGT